LTSATFSFIFVDLEQPLTSIDLVLNYMVGHYRGGVVF